MSLTKQAGLVPGTPQLPSPGPLSPPAPSTAQAPAAAFAVLCQVFVPFHITKLPCVKLILSVHSPGSTSWELLDVQGLGT